MSTSAAIDEAREDDEGDGERERPGPAEFDKVQIEGIVRAGEIGPRDGQHVRDQRDQEQTRPVDAHLDARVNENDLSAYVK